MHIIIVRWGLRICLGADVICSETVMNPMQMYIEDIDGSASHDDEMRFLFTIRFV